METEMEMETKMEKGRQNYKLGNSMSNQQAKCICVSDFHETWWTCT